MLYPVLVRKEAPDRFVAQPMGLPELREMAQTEQDAIDRVGEALKTWAGSVKVVQVSVPVGGEGNPWLDSFGRSATDPDFEELESELERTRGFSKP